MWCRLLWMRAAPPVPPLSGMFVCVEKHKVITLNWRYELWSKLVPPHGIFRGGRERRVPRHVPPSDLSKRHGSRLQRGRSGHHPGQKRKDSFHSSSLSDPHQAGPQSDGRVWSRWRQTGGAQHRWVDCGLDAQFNLFLFKINICFVVIVQIQHNCPLHLTHPTYSYPIPMVCLHVLDLDQPARANQGWVSEREVNTMLHWIQMRNK